MSTVKRIDRYFDESAESLIGLPIAEAVLDVMTAGLRVEVSRPGVSHRVRDSSQSSVSLVADRRGVVVDVLRIDQAARAAREGVRPHPVRSGPLADESAAVAALSRPRGR